MVVSLCGVVKNMRGYVRRCMDRRFGQATRKAFEEKTGLAPTDYWDESYPEYAASHGATMFGYQAHGDHCGGQPDVSDADIQARLDVQIAQLSKKYPGRHFRIFATEAGVEIKEV